MYAASRAVEPKLESRPDETVFLLRCTEQKDPVCRHSRLLLLTHLRLSSQCDRKRTGRSRHSKTHCRPARTPRKRCDKGVGTRPAVQKSTLQVPWGSESCKTSSTLPEHKNRMSGLAPGNPMALSSCQPSGKRTSSLQSSPALELQRINSCWTRWGCVWTPDMSRLLCKRKDNSRLLLGLADTAMSPPGVQKAPASRERQD
mmetsp:Transcript_23407/g.54467  ORF Transcript_23407/g.54467 Transcript_23407/m.54467 type:complete len:201 (+) Transcript_23407:60-662(+)